MNYGKTTGKHAGYRYCHKQTLSFQDALTEKGLRIFLRSHSTNMFTTSIIFKREIRLVDAFFFACYLTVNTCLKNIYFKILDQKFDNSPFLPGGSIKPKKETHTVAKSIGDSSGGGMSLQRSAFDFSSPFLKPFSLLAHNISLESNFDYQLLNSVAILKDLWLSY